MKKTEKNKEKDFLRLKGKKWENKSSKMSKRKTGSGVVFGGRYVDDK